MGPHRAKVKAGASHRTLSEVPGEAGAGALVAEVAVELVRLGQAVVAGDFDEAAAEAAKLHLRGLDQQSAEALAAMLRGYHQHVDSPDRLFAVQRWHDV